MYILKKLFALLLSLCLLTAALPAALAEASQYAADVVSRCDFSPS